MAGKGSLKTGSTVFICRFDAPLHGYVHFQVNLLDRWRVARPGTHGVADGVVGRVPGVPRFHPPLPPGAVSWLALQRPGLASGHWLFLA
jgi:hypothetical protein